MGARRSVVHILGLAVPLLVHAPLAFAASAGFKSNCSLIRLPFPYTAKEKSKLTAPPRSIASSSISSA